MFRSLLGQRSVTCLLPEAWAIDPSSQNNSQQRFVSAMAVVQDTDTRARAVSAKVAAARRGTRVLYRSKKKMKSDTVYGDAAHLRRHLTARATSKNEGTLILRTLCILGHVAIAALQIYSIMLRFFSPSLAVDLQRLARVAATRERGHSPAPAFTGVWCLCSHGDWTRVPCSLRPDLT